MPKTLMERLTLTHIKIIFQNTKSQKLPDKKVDFFKKSKSQNWYLDFPSEKGQRQLFVTSPLELTF